MRVMIVPLLAAGLAMAGCAKKSYVHREVGEVNEKVDASGLTDFEGEGARVKGPSTARTSRRVSIHRRRTRNLLRGSNTQSRAILGRPWRERMAW